MLGQPVSMLIPEVVGFKLTGALAEGITATDLVLTVTQMLRQKGVVGRFVEFYGPGVASLSLADRATLANMSPEYGATCGFFPIDEKTIEYMRLTGRDDQTIAITEAYAREQGLWRRDDAPDATYTDTLGLDMGQVVPSLAGPKRPQDRIALSELDEGFNRDLSKVFGRPEAGAQVPVEGEDYEFGDGDVAIAAITSCTNTSNPAVLVAAGLVAKKAREKGLFVKPWVKTSLAPGSQVVTDYLSRRACRTISTRRGSTWSAMAAPPASEIRARCRRRYRKRSTTTIWSRRRCCRATAISKGACRPTFRPTISPARRWWSPMR